MRLGRPIPLALAAYATLLATWSLVVAPRLPARVFGLEETDRSAVWIEGAGPLWTLGEVDGAELLVVGDSRLPEAILVDELERAGLSDVGALWAGSAVLELVVPAVRAYPARELVVCLSALGLRPLDPGPLADVFRGDPLPLEPDDTSAEFEAWRARRHAELVESGHPERAVRAVLDRLARLRERYYRQVGWRPEAIDSRTAHALDRIRVQTVRTVRPRSWREGWLPVLDESAARPTYEKMVEDFRPEAWSAARERLVEHLRALVRDGWTVTCVRLPVSETIRALEEEVTPDAVFSSLCEEAGVRYLDRSRADFRTYDGSHLLHDEAVRFSRRLAADLRSR